MILALFQGYSVCAVKFISCVEALYAHVREILLVSYEVFCWL